MNLKSLVWVSILLVGCTGSLSPVQLVSWLEAPENGLTVEYPQEDYVLRMTVLPAQLLAYKQFQVLEEPYTDSAFDAVEKQFKTGRYFRFIIDFNENPSAAKSFLEEHSDYLNFYLARDLVLVTEGDTVPCAMANLERSANISPKLMYEVAFDVPEDGSNKDFSLIYTGELSNNEPLLFTYSRNDLMNIPHLKR